MKKIILLIMLVLSFLSGLPYNADADKNGLLLSPENNGLQLGLKITTKRENNLDKHTISIKLKNTGREPVTLIPLKSDRVGYILLKKNTFNEYLKSKIGFHTFPEIPVESCQVQEKDMPSIQQKIDPGKEIQLIWHSSGFRLKDEYYYGVSSKFPLPGLYTVHAKLSVETKEGKQIHLFSNPQQVTAGGSSRIPKFTVGYIKYVSLKENIAVINLGIQNGIKEGDIFLIGPPLPFGPGWKLKVIKSSEYGSRGRIIRPENLRKRYDTNEAKKRFFLEQTQTVKLIIPK